MTKQTTVAAKSSSGSHSEQSLLPLNKLHRDVPATLIHIELGPEETDHLGMMGIFPGVGITPCGNAPGGDPRIYRIDQSEIALRNATAKHILVRVENHDQSPAAEHHG
jgi:Fe2+ transport system protein FeoA